MQFLKLMIIIFLMFLTSFRINAEVSQTPLLTQSGAVQPNLIFIFDDSGSMESTYMYQYGSDPDGYGLHPSSTTYAKYSPDVNMMYYDPRVKYKPRLNSDGTEMMAGTVTSTISYNVYFYKPSVATSLKVSSVTIKSGGSKYPTSGMGVTFSAPPSGGVQATGTVTVNGSKQITGITVTNGGTGYTSKPTITLINKGSGKSASWTVNTVSDGVTAVNAKWDGTGSLGSSNFFATGTPAGYTPDATSPLASGATTSVSYPNVASSSVTSYPHFVNRTDCQSVTCNWTEELQNYANWKTYYSTRVELARTAVGYAFKTIGSTIRVGWGTINRIESNTALDAGVSLFDATRKSEFYTWLYGANTAPSGDTPNRLAIDRVGQYYSRMDSDGPWGTSPNYASTSTLTSTTGGAEARSSHAACRRSNVMLVTDGYWNGASASLGNIDNSTSTTITSTTGQSYQYVPVAPYSDTTSNTLADVAMKYWVTDLRTDLPNNIPTIAGVNESFWQNMSFYGIGMGVYGSLPQTADILAGLNSGGTSWPAATANDPTAIDDMWHAAINGRGQYFSVGDSDSLTKSMQKMMVTINKVTSSQSGVSISTAYLVDGTTKYSPQYTTGSWSGNIMARLINPTTGAETTTTWQVESRDILTGDPVSTIPDYSSRNIFVGTGSTSTPKAVTFTYSAMSGASLLSSMTGTINADLINYLRGDASNEGDGGKYRTRETRLGDIVNSAPVFVKKGIDLGYDSLPSGTAGASTYRAFATSQATNDEGVLFVGANDGMLHGFRDGTTSSPEDRGVEVFAYVPKSVLPNLSQLSDKSYAHRYYVDGPATQNFAYINGAWANVLMGTTGAGAKSVFALNVTDPLSMNASSVLWEVSNQTSGFSELGYVLSEVRVGILPSGNWVAIFGNGYESASGTARLFVVNLQTGALLKVIDTGVGGSNGLGAVRVVKNGSGQIVGVYAGDLKGNLWKFDLSNVASSGWTVGLSGSPLISVGANKPITAAPIQIVHPNGGYLVSFGTGKMFESTDIATTTQQSLYGVWDPIAFGATSTPTGTTLTGVTNLVQQTISVGSNSTITVVTTALTTTTQSVTSYNFTNLPVDWATKRGWYLDLPNNGERAIYPERLLSDNVVLVNTLSPINVSTAVCTASGQGTGYLYAFSILNGGAGNITLRDSAGVSLGNGVSYYANGPISTAERDSNKSSVFGGGSGDSITVDRCADGSCGGAGTRVINERNWRQIFMR